MAGECASCMARRQWLINNTPEWMTPLWYEFNAAAFTWDTISNLLASALWAFVLYEAIKRLIRNR